MLITILVFGQEHVLLQNVYGGLFLFCNLVAEETNHFHFQSSPQTDVNQSGATTRLIEHRCRLARRGVGAGPIAPDYCSVPYTPYVQALMKSFE